MVLVVLERKNKNFQESELNLNADGHRLDSDWEVLLLLELGGCYVRRGDRASSVSQAPSHRS